MVVDKVMELQRKGDAGAVANPTLEDICQIMSKSLKGLTPSAQRRAFEHCLLTLPTDGSLDQEKGSKNVMALLNKYGQSLVPNEENSIERFPRDNQPCESGGKMLGTWGSLIAWSTALPSSEFYYNPPLPSLPKAQPAKAQGTKANR